MNIIEPSIEIISDLNITSMLNLIEKAGRTCYKSEDKIDIESSLKFISSLIKRGHESVLEHQSITVKVICDRGVSHEIVRHRIMSFSQESTRYCNYSSDKFKKSVTFIKPMFWLDNSPEYKIWKDAMAIAENRYFRILGRGAKPEEARSILPNSLKTELVITANLREWRYFLKLRTTVASHPQMRQVANLILTEFKNRIPIIFEDV